MDDQCVLADLEWVASGNGSTSVQTLGVKEDTDPFSWLVLEQALHRQVGKLAGSGWLQGFQQETEPHRPQCPHLKYKPVLVYTS